MSNQAIENVTVEITVNGQTYTRDIEHRINFEQPKSGT